MILGVKPGLHTCQAYAQSIVTLAQKGGPYEFLPKESLKYFQFYQITLGEQLNSIRLPLDF